MERKSRSRRRYRDIGETAIGRQLTVIFTLRKAGALVRVISACNMNAKERKLYEQEIKSNPEI